MIACIFSSTLSALYPCSITKQEEEYQDLSNPCVQWSKALKYRIGFLGDFIFNRELEYRQEDNNGGVVQDTIIFSQGPLIGLHVLDWIWFEAFLGVASIEIETPAEANRFFSVWEFDPNFCWSVELGTTLWNWGNSHLYFSGLYYHTETDLENYYDLGGGSVFHFEEESGAVYYNWQLSLGGAYELSSGYGFSLIPYAVLKFSQARLSFEGEFFTHEGTEHQIFDLQNRKTLGYGLGCRATINHQFTIGIENRLADDRAVMVSAALIF